MSGAWASLSATMQDLVILIAVLLPLGVVAATLLRGYAPWTILRARLRRDRWVNLVFVLLIGVSVGTSIALIAQERGLREGSAQAAQKFDLIVGAPGSELTLMFAAVYLQPTVVPLIGGEIYQELTQDPRVDFAAPLAFGDSYQGAPIVGTTADFALHLSGARIAGQMFSDPFEALAGAKTGLKIGETFTPAHGRGAFAQAGQHGDDLTVVGRLPVTGTPWDSAILTPIEGVWLVHGLGSGKDVDIDAVTLGPPYDPRLFPGTPAVIVKPTDLSSGYTLQSSFRARGDAMAFFPGTVLARLHNVLGDMRQAMSVLSVVTQVMVAASVLTALYILGRLYRGQLTLLNTLGAPARFTLALVWSHAALLLALGTVLGVVLGLIAAAALSAYLSAQTGITIRARITLAELWLAALFLSGSALVALGLGAAALHQARTDPFRP